MGERIAKANKLLVALYGSRRRFVRNFVRWIVLKTEGGEFLSQTLRAIMRKYYEVDIGLYTHGGCFVPFSVGRHTTIGRYCSFANTVRIVNRNHPLEHLSTHAYFFNPKLGKVKEDRVSHTPLVIGSDVWFGHNSIVMPAVQAIGDGAVIAAGAVISKDVPPYAVMVGNPARAVRFRFPQEQIDVLLASKWWERPLEELPIEEMNTVLNDELLKRVLGTDGGSGSAES